MPIGKFTFYLHYPTDNQNVTLQNAKQKNLKISVLFSEVFSEELLINNHCRFKCKIEAQYVYESFLFVMHMTPHDFWVTWSMTRGFLSKLLPKHFDRILFKDMFVSEIILKKKA